MDVWTTQSSSVTIFQRGELQLGKQPCGVAWYKTDFNNHNKYLILYEHLCKDKSIYSNGIIFHKSLTDGSYNGIL